MASLAARRIARRHSSSSLMTSSSSATTSTSSTSSFGGGGDPPTPHVHPHPYRLQPTLVPLSLSAPPRPRSLASHRTPSPRPNRRRRPPSEYDDIMDKFDLRAQDPYSGTAYAESSFPRSGGGPEKIVEVDEEEEESDGRKPMNVDCRMCLKKAVSRVHARCCNTVFCRPHIDEWLEREESKGLCPMCDKPCVLPRASPPPPPLLSVSACRSEMSSTTTLVVEEGWWESEAEDTWDAKGAWKKSDGGSLDVKEMMRDVVGELLQFAVVLIWVGHRSGATTRVASVVGLILVLFILLR